MKINLFAVNKAEDLNESGLREAGGHRAIGLVDPEANLVQAIDEKRMLPLKVLVTRFLSFLSNRRLSLNTLKTLSIEEQSQIRKEFLGSI